MYIPFISSKRPKLFRRKGGGGGGGHGGSGGGTSGGSVGSTGSSGGTRSPVSIGSGSTTDGKTSATSYGAGGGKVAAIPSGQLFAGRTQGGGTREQVFGTSTYGSGYPGLASSRGVAGLGFPFFFWPVIWGTAAAGGAGADAAYLHTTEYGNADNSSRPGGVLTTVAFSSASGNTTMHIVADNATTTSLLSSVAANCSSLLASNSTGGQTVLAFNPSNTSSLQPEQAVEYYRASSIVLTLDGYNDTVALQQNASANTPPTPLPSWVNVTMLDCLNQTIGAAAPLINGAPSPMGLPVNGVGIIGLAWIAWHLLPTIL
ncbi:hypothetical protein M0805_005230 [Coniferiporia weirii]|nr:hypothetical protein M0805_005230 [Coniferiporia weirii]